MTATDPLALDGRDGRAADRGDRASTASPRAFLLDEIAGAHRRRDRRRDRRRPPARPGAARAARPPRPRLRLPDPRRADLAAALRPARPLARDRRPTTSCCATSASPARSSPTWSCASARCRPASRCAPGWRRAAPTRSSSTPTAAGTSRRSGAAAILRADPTELAAGWATRLEKEERGEPTALARGRAGGARRRSTAELDGGARDLPSRPCTCALGRAHRDGDLVYTASSMPIRDQEAFLAPGDADVALPLQPRRQRHRRPDLLRDRRRPRAAAARPRSSPATSACSTTSAASPPCARSRPRSASS